MINALVISMFVAVLGIEYLVRERGMLHPYVVLLPELLSAIVAVLILARMVAGVRISLDWRYVAFIVVLSVTMLFAFMIQEMPAGPIVAGLREHLKFLPFFFLPAVFKFTPAQFKVQLGVLLAFFLLQAPLATYQRFIEYAHMMETGDPVRGTATTSSALSILMMCGISAVVTFYLRGRIRLPTVVVLIGAFFLPSMLNETKGTVLMLPVALIAPALFMPRRLKPFRKLVPIAAIGSASMLAFIVAYDHFARYSRFGTSLGTFVEERRFVEYLYSGAAEEGANYIGRFDSLKFAWDHISEDPFRLAFGYGAGNVSMSFLPEFNGEYAAYYDRFGVGMTQVTKFLWEIGVIGLLAYLMLYAIVFKDAWTIARRDDEGAMLGQIWATVMLIMTFGLVYKSVFAMSEIGYLFWFFTGVVASRAVEQRREHASSVSSPRHRPERARGFASDETGLRGPEPVYWRG